MGFLKSLFGGKSAEEHEKEGDSLKESGDFGGAKLSYDKALGKYKDQSQKLSVAEKIDVCLDSLAEARIAEAERLIAQGDPGYAREELANALEIAANKSVKAKAQEVIDRLERGEAIQAVEVETDLTDEERLALLAGTWDTPQEAEYEEYGDPFYDAILALHNEEHEVALKGFEAVLEAAEAPRYLWLELGRARILNGDLDGGQEALEEFLESLADDERGDHRLIAHIELAAIAREKEEFERAIELYQGAIDDFPQDYRPYYVMGAYLRSRELPESAADLLVVAASKMGERADWRVLQELGLAHRDAEQDQDAVRVLEDVIALLTERNHLDFPVKTAVALAELHEEAGKLDRAADLYAALSRGSDTENHCHYHREAGRLLTELGLRDEAKRMLKRAVAIAPDDEAKEAAQTQLAAL